MRRLIPTLCLIIISASLSLAQADRNKMEVKKFGIAILKTPDRIPVSQELPEVVTKHQAELLQLAWTYPEEFNYPWVDWRTGEIVVDVATAEEFQFATQLRNDHQIKQRIRRVKYSLAQLRRIRDDLFARKHIEAFSELNSIREIEMDLENNRLVVLTDQVSDELLITLATRWSGDGIAVRQIQKRTPSTSSFQANEEPVCTQTFAGPIETRFDYTRWRVRGGSCVNGGKVCTNGFSWHYGGDIYGMISAGHCFANGDVQYASAPSPDLSGASGNQVFGQVWGARWENWKPRLGTCAFDYSGRDTCPNPPIYGGQAGDLASIQMKQYSLENARIFTGFTATAPVREMGTNNYSNSVCTGGSVSGQVCGWAVDALWTAVAEYDKFGNLDGVAVEVHRASKASSSDCLKQGDSGGPVYYIRTDGGVMAKGIISGKWYDSNERKCYVWYTDIQTVKWTFGGSLHTQNERG